MLLSLRQLEIVHAVCRHGSVTAAAAALEVSQPAISMVLRDCTRLTGFPLFRRKQGRLQPTPEMQVMLPDLMRMFEGAERIDRLLGDIRETSVGTVHLAVTPTLADSLLPRAVAIFQLARPRITLTLRTMDNVSVVEAVTGRKCSDTSTLPRRTAPAMVWRKSDSAVRKSSGSRQPISRKR